MVNSLAIVWNLKFSACSISCVNFRCIESVTHNPFKTGTDLNTEHVTINNIFPRPPPLWPRFYESNYDHAYYLASEEWPRVYGHKGIRDVSLSLVRCPREVPGLEQLPGCRPGNAAPLPARHVLSTQTLLGGHTGWGWGSARGGAVSQVGVA